MWIIEKAKITIKKRKVTFEVATEEWLAVKKEQLSNQHMQIIDMG